MRPFRELPRDEEGTFLVFFGIALAVLLGMVALSFDLGRVAVTQTELQSFADQVALAAAAELDGGTGAPNAIDRALDAAEDLLTDTQTFAQGGQDLDFTDVTLTFLRDLPATDSAADPVANIVCVSGTDCDSVTDDEVNDAILVRVDVARHTLPLGFASVLSVLTGGEEREASVAATATAGFTQFACDVTPLMFCLPPEGVEEGQMINLVAGNGGAGAGMWGPGNFGFLDVENTVDPDGVCGDEKGAANIARCVLGATESITECYSIRGVDTRTGARVGITTDPFNYRFDMYPTSMKAADRNSATFAPAPNTVRGFVPTVKVTGPSSKPKIEIDWCTPDATAYTASAPSMGFPRDQSLSSTLRFGTDRTFAGPERTTYVARNYGGTDPFPAGTRYDFYRAEIDAAGGPSAGTAILGATATAPYRETGRSECSTAQSENYDRRVVIAAAINCDPTAGGTEIKGDTDDVPVEEFFRIFLTEPVGTTGGTLSLYGEVIGSAGGSGSGGETGGGIFRDVVQLYR